MRALKVSPEDGVRLVHIEQQPRPGECRIGVRMAGICGTDLQLLQGYAEFSGIPGHEFVGVVEEATDPALIGKRVVGEINVGCGRCSWCLAGVKEHCLRRSVLGIKERSGAFCESVWLPASNLHEVPDQISDRMAVFVEPIAAACQILRQVSITATARVAVVGDGRLGLVIGQVLRSTGAPVVVFGKHAWKLEVARSLGLSTNSDATQAEATGQSTSTDEPSQKPFDLVVDATGHPSGLSRSLELVRPRGTIVLKSTFHGDAPLLFWPAVVNEITLVGSRCGPFADAIDLLARGAINVEPLISRVCELEEYDTAFDAARRELKVIFRVNR